MHLSLSFFLVASFVSSIIAIPSISNEAHEKRDGSPQGWKRSEKLPGTFMLYMRIALVQENLERAEEFLLEMSHPDSKKYGQHWSAKEITETFAPTLTSVETVTGWLTSAGIAQERISKSQSLGWLTLSITIDEAESLLETEYHIYRHSTGRFQAACTEYFVPPNIRPHIDFITPTVHFDTKISSSKRQGQQKSGRALYKAAIDVPVEAEVAFKVGSSKSGSHLKKGPEVAIDLVNDDLAECHTRITPQCLRELYQFGPGISANPQNSYGIVEYTPQTYIQEDLNLFFDKFSANQKQRTPILNFVDSGSDQFTHTGFNYNGESSLDLEYAMVLANPQNITLYQVGDLYEAASFNNFLDAIDASYCTFDGGDDELQDAAYPSPVGGYQGPNNCGGFAATKVISTSYGYNEATLTARYERRQCLEYLKLGLAGTTMLFSSGDYGVAGISNQCIDPVTSSYNSGASGVFNPSFPGTCPYVTSVGGTQIKAGGLTSEPEIACEKVIYSGGGFSNVFPLPSYQFTAVKSWYRDHPPPYGADRFNDSQRTRGFPDISANGADYLIAVGGMYTLTYGTSASAPVVGAIFTLINEARMNLGKSSIGFVNPFLYANPETLNDITAGYNPGCGTNGFEAVKGWDPVTGLGTPNYPKLLQRFLALP